MKVLSAWKNYPTRWMKPRGVPPNEPAHLWDWLWAGVDWNLSALADRAGLITAKTRHKFEVLRGARLVYPDGTISHVALGLLAKHVSRHLPKSKRGD